MTGLTALIIVVCVAAGPLEPERCGIEHQIPVAVTPIECALLGQQIALGWMQDQGSVLEFTRLVGWRCESGGRA